MWAVRFVRVLRRVRELRICTYHHVGQQVPDELAEWMGVRWQLIGRKCTIYHVSYSKEGTYWHRTVVTGRRETGHPSLRNTLFVVGGEGLMSQGDSLHLFSIRNAYLDSQNWNCLFLGHRDSQGPAHGASWVAAIDPWSLHGALDLVSSHLNHLKDLNLSGKALVEMTLVQRLLVPCNMQGTRGDYSREGSRTYYRSTSPVFRHLGRDVCSLRIACRNGRGFRRTMAYARRLAPYSVRAIVVLMQAAGRARLIRCNVGGDPGLSSSLGREQPLNK